MECSQPSIFSYFYAIVECRTRPPTPRASRSPRSQFSFGVCVNREVGNSLFRLESEDRANKPNKTFRKCCSSSRMQNCALLPILSWPPWYCSQCLQQLSVSDMPRCPWKVAYRYFDCVQKANLSCCRRKSAKITRSLTLDKFLLENCVEEMNNG